jgi:hypothetical protein
MQGERTIIFQPLLKLEPGATAEFEVFVRGLKVGEHRFTVQLSADQIREGGPVQETESTVIYSEDAPPPRFDRPVHRRRLVIPLADGLE